jgi:RNA polymerase sigma-70 factor (ECF subfamily)
MRGYAAQDRLDWQEHALLGRQRAVHAPQAGRGASRRRCVSSDVAGGSGADGAETHSDDVHLARDARQGSLAARKEFATRMHCVPRMLSALNERLGRPLAQHDLEDLVQDSLVVVWRGLVTYAGYSSLETWVFRCCQRELIARLRARRPAFETLDQVQPTVESIELTDVDAVHRALESLAAKERRVIELKHFEDLTFAVIGERLGLSPNTAKAWYYRGLEELRRLLAPTLRKERS